MAHAKTLRKNSIALDIILIGEESAYNGAAPLLRAVAEIVNVSDNSRFVHVPSSLASLSDVVLPALGAAAPLGEDTEGVDDELALALQMSLEESREASGDANASTGEKRRSGFLDFFGFFV